MELNCPDIGPGFVIGHGYGSVIWAQSIGSDCRVSQGVTMGYGRKGTRLPVLGDGVRIHANACIIGARIGDGATVGAGAVVIHDVAAGDVVVGAPARSIRR
jgi:serine O-acetyltransferase